MLSSANKVITYLAYVFNINVAVNNTKTKCRVNFRNYFWAVPQ